MKNIEEEIRLEVKKIVNIVLSFLKKIPISNEQNNP